MTLYGDAGREVLTVETYLRHIAWVKKIVPEEMLVFFNVKEGWEPVPERLKFPRINYGEAMEGNGEIGEEQDHTGLGEMAGNLCNSRCCIRSDAVIGKKEHIQLIPI